MTALAAQTKRDDRRDAILDAARQVFLTEGYAAASMSCIAARVGGSKGTLYNYFKSKEELFDAFMRRDCARLARASFAIPKDDGDLHRRLVAFAEGFITLLLTPEALAAHRLVVGEGEQFPELGRAFYAAGPQIVLGHMTNEMGALMDQGRLRRADPALAATQFKDLAISGMYQLRMWGIIPPPTREEVGAQARTAVDTFLRAYGPEGRS